ncbi:MAG: trehalose-phosphatase [Magnetococcales bacterium]|nr:trehalose-phosphatase [Magnetococcales bacterium]
MPRLSGDMSPPFPTGDKWAMFLDVDGTLLEMMDDPNGVVVPEGIHTLLKRLKNRFNGALALVSGRSLSSLDGLFGGVDLDAAGCHGGEWRQEGIRRSLKCEAAFDNLARCLEHRLADFPGIILERKPCSLALHYRQPLASPAQARQLARSLIPFRESPFRLLEGKRVIEILPRGAGKDTAISRFLETSSYTARTPVFIGDDLTDEEGFAEVNRRGGISIRVGLTGETVAHFRCPSVSGVTRWLESLDP